MSSAICSARAAPAVWQPYRNLAKLLRKRMLLAENASWLFRAVPYIVFGAMWPALELLIHDNIVPDFPVCNKLVNGSYSGQNL